MKMSLQKLGKKESESLRKKGINFHGTWNHKGKKGENTSHFSHLCRVEF